MEVCLITFKTTNKIYSFWFNIVQAGVQPSRFLREYGRVLALAFDP